MVVVDDGVCAKEAFREHDECEESRKSGLPVHRGPDDECQLSQP